MLEVRNLVKIYSGGVLRRRRTKAVDDVTFSIGDKEVVSLVGESGSGKTTLALVILRLLFPTSGEVLFCGRNVHQLKGRDLRWYWQQVHGILQDPYAAFNPIYKADRVLYQCFDLFSKRVFNKTKTVEEALLAVGLKPQEVRGRYPHQLSGGQLQRILIARCFILRPKLIVADEPVSMLDASMRVEILKLFEQLKDSYGTSVLFITHDLGLAYYCSSRLMVMLQGKIVEEGVPEDILEHPKHPYTQRLITDIPLLRSKWKEVLSDKIT